MDPVGPWSAYAAASYNRLANATAVTAATAGNYHHQLASVGVTPGGSHPSSGSTTTTASAHQLLLQAAHASAAGAVNTPSAFNPGRFLASPHVGYDPVFSPLFHQKAHYNSSLNQRHATLKQTSNDGGETNVGAAAAADIVGPYSTVHHQTLAAAAGALFEHPSSASSSPYQGSGATQLHSPFGILPHESVLSGGPSGPGKSNVTTSAAGGPFENAFTSHFTSSGEPQNENIQDSDNEFCHNATNKKINKNQTAPVNKPAVTISQSPSPTSVAKPVVVGGSLYTMNVPQQQRAAPIVTIASTINNSSNSFVTNNSFENVNKACLQLNQSSINSTKKQLTPLDRRQIPQSELHAREKCNSGQSSPICFTMPSVDQSSVANYSSNSNNSSTNISPNNAQARSLLRNNVITVAQYHSPLRPVVSPISYSNQNTMPVKTPPSDNLIEMTNVITQKSPDCGVVVPKRPSPLLAQSRSSPLSHVPSPLYPVYNSPVASINNSPTQQPAHAGSMSTHCQQPQHIQQNYIAKSSMNADNAGSQSPLDVTMQRRPAHDSTSDKQFPVSSADCNSLTTRTWNAPSTDHDRNGNNANGNRHKNGNRANVINPPGYGIGSVVQKLHEQQMQQQHQQQQQLYFNYRNVPDRMLGPNDRSNEERRRVPEPCVPAEEVLPSSSIIKHSRKGNERNNNVNSRESVVSNVQAQPLTRVPPPAHNNNQPPQFENYFEYERWNLTGPMKNLPRNPVSQPEHNAMQLSRSDSGICNNGSNNNANSIIVSCGNNATISTGDNTMNHMNQVDHSQTLNLPPAFYHHPHITSQLTTSGPIYHHPHRISTELHLTLANNIPHDDNQCRTICELQNQPVEAIPDIAKGVIDEQPKVLVPNIEEELDFLNDDRPITQETNIISTCMPNPKNGGFMESYLKFLQGERAPSPPATGRVVKRTPYTKIQPPNTGVSNSSINSSCGTVTTTTASAAPKVTSASTTYSLEDDPRYFPLPKTSAHRGSLDSSDDENNDHGEFSCFKTKKTEKENPPIKLTEKKSISAKQGVVTQRNKNVNKRSGSVLSANKVKLPSNVSINRNIKKVLKLNTSSGININSSTISINKLKGQMMKKKENMEVKKKVKPPKVKVVKEKVPPQKKRPYRKKEVAKIEIVTAEPLADLTPQRTVPKRKAKENLLEKKRMIVSDDEDDFLDNDIEDEDFEPDWNPMDDDDDDVGRYGRGGKKRKNKGPSTRSATSTKRLGTQQSNSTGRRNKRVKIEVDPLAGPVDEKGSLNQIAPSEKGKSKFVNGFKGDFKGSGSDSDFKCPFAVGEFLVAKNDLIEEWPPIWRVEGKALLRKFMPFEQNGEMLYKCVPTYSECNKENISTFKTVPTRIRQRSKTKTDVIVELLRSEMILSSDEQQIVDEAMKETAKYQDHFEVYIQTLLSQALDSNFLAEIIQEKDEYFLINMKAIDDLTEDHRMRMVKSLKWDERPMERSLYTWPCYNITYGVTEIEKNKTCESCDSSEETLNRVVVYGQPYCLQSLEGRPPPDEDKLLNKEMLVCKLCISMVVLYNKICHQKYLMFIECGKRVSDKRTSNPDKDTTVILNELLADETWLQHLFNKVRTTWAQVNRLEKSKKT